MESGLFTRRIPPLYKRKAIRAGPLVLLAGEYARRPPSDFEPVPRRPGRFYLQKTVDLVRAGSVVTLRVPRPERRLALAYRQSDWRIPYSRGFRLRDGERSVTFHACRADQPSFVPGKHRPVGRWTEFNGALVIAGAHCATLAVGRVRVQVGFGVRRCALRAV